MGLQNETSNNTFWRKLSAVRQMLLKGSGGRRVYFRSYTGGAKILIICREIDEALRPGVYALLDVCSANDLQYLHTVFGGKQSFAMMTRVGAT